MVKSKNVKNRIFLFVFLFGLFFSSVSPSLAFSAENNGTSYITVFSDSQNDYGLYYEDIGFFRVDYEVALGRSLFTALENARSSGLNFPHLQTQDSCNSFFQNFVFSDIGFDNHRVVISVSHSYYNDLLYCLFVPVSSSLASLQNGQLDNQSVVVLQDSSYHSVYANSPVGNNVVPFSLTTIIANASQSPSSLGFDVSDYSNKAFILVFNFTNNLYDIWTSNHLNSNPFELARLNSPNNSIILISAPVYFYPSSADVSFSVSNQKVTIPYLDTYPGIIGNYFNDEIYVFPTFTPIPTLTPIPTVIPTLSPTPIILPYDSSVDLVSDGSTIGFLDTIQGTFDGLQGLAVLTFFGDLITFIYHESNVFGVLLLFIPLISFIVFLIGRSK